jgi:hypothetical protein
MYMKSMSWVSIIAFVPAVFLPSSTNYRIALEFIICWAAASIIIQALRARKYEWAATFLLIALVFNPIVPVTVSDNYFRWLDVACIGIFVASLFYLKAMPRPAVISIALPRAR